MPTTRKYYLANRSKLLQAAKEKYKKNPEKHIEASKAWQAKNPERVLWNTARARARKMGIAFNLKVEDIVIPEKCPIFGVLMTSPGRYAPTIDRIDNTKGYTPENIQVLSKLANQMKSSATPEELVLFSKYFYNIFQQ